MKKIIAICLMLLCCNAFAQDVTKFLGIPVDGSKKEMIRKLKEKGFLQDPYYDEVLTGQFNGSDVNIHIVTNNDKVCRIMVCDANTMDETNIRIRFNVLCEQFKNNSRYISFSEDDQKIPDNEDISYGMTVQHKRYQAAFYQRLDTIATNYKDELWDLVQSMYTEEQLENPSEEIVDDISKMSITYVFYKAMKKTVWFMISESYGQYYITMFYDNEYNRANGEDL